MTKNVTIAWDILPTRADGTELPTADIAGTEVSVRVDNDAAPWTVLDTISAASPQDFTLGDVDVGDWVFRLVVIDTNERQSVPQEFKFSVGSEAVPSGVGNVVITQA